MIPGDNGRGISVRISNNEHRISNIEVNRPLGCARGDKGAAIGAGPVERGQAFRGKNREEGFFFKNRNRFAPKGQSETV